MPFLILGGELGNSSAACPQDIERIFRNLKNGAEHSIGSCLLGADRTD